MRSRWLRKLALALASTLVALVVVGEIGLRLWNPTSVRVFDNRATGAPGERVVKIDKTYEVHPDNGIFQLDDKLGYRPIPGGRAYAANGAKFNDYPAEKPPGKKRLLFIGDSVTERAKIIDALHARLGEDYEYWNAGVVGYATEQEFLYYRDYLAGIRADHVILTFHLNDYETTPVTFPVGDELVSVHSRVGRSYPNPWLLVHSYIYRFAWSYASRVTSTARKADIEAEVVHYLELLRDLVRQRGADFTVLVLPWLLPKEGWPEPKPRQHELTLATLERLGIRHYDFVATLQKAVADGLQIHEQKNDPQHPSAEFAERMVDDLLARGFRP